MSSIKTARIQAMVILLLLGAGIFALHATGDATREDPAAGSESAFSRGAVKAFSALTLPAQTLPRRLQRQVGADLGAKSRTLAPSSARKVAADAWLVGGRGVVCLISDPTGAAACSSDHRFIHHGIFLGTFQAADHGKMPTDFMVLGAVPDWVSSLEIEIGKRRRILPVNGNLARMRADSPILVRRLMAQGD
jgi:hypothetical protein